MADYLSAFRPNLKHLVLATSSLAFAAGCGDDDGPTPAMDASTTQPPGTGETVPDAGAAADSGTIQPAPGMDSGVAAKDPIYLVVMRVWSQDGALQYAKLSRTLDVNYTAKDFDDAYEFGGYAGFTVRNGQVLVGDQETPFVTKYEVTDDLKWKQVGEKLNFTTYYEDSGDGLNDHYQAKAGNDQFFFYGPSRSLIVHWLVDEWKIAGASTTTNIPKRDGWELNNMGNRARSESFKDKIVWPFVLSDASEGSTLTPESYLAVYDRATNQEVSVLHPKCPELFYFTFDEQQNLYFTPMWRSPLPALYGQSIHNCVVKVRPDGTVDPSFGTDGERDIGSMTGGLPGNNFRYMGNGKAVVNVFHKDQITGATFTGPIPENVLCQIEDCGDDKTSLYNPKVWEYHVIDLATNTSKPMWGYLSDEHKYNNFRLYYQVDGRTFFAAGSDKGLVMYELNLDTAEVKVAGESAFQTADGSEYTVVSRLR